MRSVFPDHAEGVDPVSTYLGADRAIPSGRPWVAVGMVTSVDGATSVDGLSGALGGDADRQVFRAVRAIADVIFVGAATVRAENYGPVHTNERIEAERERLGRSRGPARLAIVSASLDLDPDDRVFSGPPPMVFTTDSAATRADERLRERAEIIACGDGAVSLSDALAHLGDGGARVVVCEGGPSLVAQLVAADLVDEWCVNVAATVAGGTSARIVHDAPAVDQPVELASIIVGDGLVATRWLRRR